MPGILPMKVIRVGVDAPCEYCSQHKLSCDLNLPKCLNCLTAKIECKGRSGQRIPQACDRCRSKKIRCDGIRPGCSQCGIAGFACQYSDKLSRRAFPRGYTESLEERLRWLETETRELKDLVDEKDEKIDMLNRLAVREQKALPPRRKARKPKKASKLETTEDSEMATKALHVYTFDIERNQMNGDESPAGKQSHKKTKISVWVEEKVQLAINTQAPPAVNLLVIDSPDDPMEENFRLLKTRGMYSEVSALTGPVLDTLDLPRHVLDTFGSVVFDKCPLSATRLKPTYANSSQASTYHIALGFFSLAFRYFPESSTCIGILLVQNYKDVAAELLRDLNTHQSLIGNPLLLPLLAQQGISKVVSAWLSQHKEVIIDAQAQTGYHHMVSLRRSSEFVDYTELSTKISGTAVNIATNEFCWRVLAEHAENMVKELNTNTNKSSTFFPRLYSEIDLAASEYLKEQAARIARNAKFMLYEAESWQRKSSILVQGIFNLIAQQDQSTSIGIARDSKTLAEKSKRDSTSMKVIAIVTMTFLPGTFVASLFSTSMFQWNSMSGADVVSRRFWIYWVVTVPLTFATFLVWLMWMRVRNGEGARSWVISERASVKSPSDFSMLSSDANTL